MEEEIIRVIRTNFPDLENEELDANSELIARGYITSFDVINLITILEQEFDVVIELDDLELDDFETPATISNFLSKLTPARQQATA